MIKIVEEIVKVRDELYEIQRKIEHLHKQLDGAAGDIIVLLKNKGEIE
jgi:hypothetical protein